MALTTTRIPREKLEAYFDTFSKHFAADRSTVDIEVLSMDWGDQFEAEGVRLTGITYDSKSNELDIMLESGDHRVYSPKEVWVVEETNGFISAIEIVRPDGPREVVRLKRLDVQRSSDAAARNTQSGDKAGESARERA